VEGPIDVLISYVPEDDDLCKELETHLALLKRDGIIRAWHQRLIHAGADHRAETGERLRSARVIVFLVSASYLASDRYEDEMQPALARARQGEALAVPVLLHAYDLPRELFAGLVVLPRDKPPVASWPSRHDAWAGVVREIREAIEALGGTTTVRQTNVGKAAPEPRYEDAASRALAKQFEAARARRKALLEAKASTAAVDAEILDLRRLLREGGRLRAGDTLEDGRYLLIELVGRGGFASVWSAVDREGGERVAIKVLHSELARDASRRERFFRGARVMAGLGHEAVVRVLNPGGEDGGWLYFVMELVPGGDLRRAVVNGTVTREQTMPLILGVGDALVEAHAKGVVHRDVKPANILLDASGAPRLTDFDLVAVGDTTGGTRTGAAMGTYLFMAPEQINNANSANARADVYGLGMTTMFCLHGGELPEITLRRPDKVIEGLPCSSAVRAILTKATELNPMDRFTDARAFCEALREAAVATHVVSPSAHMSEPEPHAPSTDKAIPGPPPVSDRPKAPVNAEQKLWRPMRKGLLLGAGFSHDFGMPLVGELTEVFLAAFTPSETPRFTENLARSQPYSKDRPIDPAAVRAGMDVVLRYKREAGSNYEELLGQLAAARTGPVPKQDSYNLLLTRLSELVFMILRAYQAVSYEVMYPVNRTCFSKLREFLSADETWVFSLNHDLYVECLALDLGIPITYGDTDRVTFPRSNLPPKDEVALSCCSRSQFHYEGPGWFRGAYGINLVRLHGGLAEFEHDDGAVICNPSLKHSGSSELMAELKRIEAMSYCRDDGARLGSSYDLDRIITGPDGSLDILSRPLRIGARQYMPTTKVRPGEERLKLFDDALRQLDELTIIGYSLENEHVTNRLLNAMVLNQQLKIRIVDPKSRPCPSFLRQFDYDLRVQSVACTATQWLSYVVDQRWDDAQVKALSESRKLRTEVRRLVERWPRR
jgi:serine/threonine protein kinase